MELKKIINEKESKIKQIFITISKKDFLDNSSDEAIMIFKKLNKVSSGMKYGVPFHKIEKGLEYLIKNNIKDVIAIIEMLDQYSFKYNCIIDIDGKMMIF